MMRYKSIRSENDMADIFKEIGALPRPIWSYAEKKAKIEKKVAPPTKELILEELGECIEPMLEDSLRPSGDILNLPSTDSSAESPKTSLLGESKSDYCLNYQILSNGNLKIDLKSFKDVPCSNHPIAPKPYHGPWMISIGKGLVFWMRKIEAEWKRKGGLKGPLALWPPEKEYQVKTLPTNTCLRVGVKKKEVSEVLEYIMDTNTEKFNYEPPPTVRLSWFMEEQLKRTELVNSAYDWDTDRVLEWITAHVGLPQYQESFEVNGIRGRHLVLLDAEALQKMGITDFDHILKITSEIRTLFKIRRERNVWRDVVEARYDPLTLHAMYNFKQVSRRAPIFQFYVNNHFIDRKVPHFSLFELRKSIWNIFPRNVRTVDSIMEHEGKRKRLVRVKW